MIFEVHTHVCTSLGTVSRRSDGTENKLTITLWDNSIVYILPYTMVMKKHIHTKNQGKFIYFR